MAWTLKVQETKIFSHPLQTLPPVSRNIFSTKLIVPQRYYIWKSQQAAAQSEIWTDPKGYYFCNIIVVLPSHHGRGIGKALAQEVTKRADAEGQKCYLESSRDVPNMKIYEAMGFHFVKEMECLDESDGGKCQLFCMVRDPKKVIEEE